MNPLHHHQHSPRTGQPLHQQDSNVSGISDVTNGTAKENQSPISQASVKTQEIILSSRQSSTASAAAAAAAAASATASALQNGNDVTLLSPGIGSDTSNGTVISSTVLTSSHDNRKMATVSATSPAHRQQPLASSSNWINRVNNSNGVAADGGSGGPQPPPPPIPQRGPSVPIRRNSRHRLVSRTSRRSSKSSPTSLIGSSPTEKSKGMLTAT